jgi:hypothetical protein
VGAHGLFDVVVGGNEQPVSRRATRGVPGRCLQYYATTLGISCRDQSPDAAAASFQDGEQFVGRGCPCEGVPEQQLDWLVPAPGIGGASDVDRHGYAGFVQARTDAKRAGVPASKICALICHRDDTGARADLLLS